MNQAIALGPNGELIMHNRAEGGISAANAVDDVRKQKHGMFAGCCHACGLQEVDREMLKRSV